MTDDIIFQLVRAAELGKIAYSYKRDSITLETDEDQRIRLKFNPDRSLEGVYILDNPQLKLTDLEESVLQGIVDPTGCSEECFNKLRQTGFVKINKTRTPLGFSLYTQLTHLSENIGQEVLQRLRICFQWVPDTVILTEYGEINRPILNALLALQAQ